MNFILAFVFFLVGGSRDAKEAAKLNDQCLKLYNGVDTEKYLDCRAKLTAVTGRLVATGAFNIRKCQPDKQDKGLVRCPLWVSWHQKIVEVRNPEFVSQFNKGNVQAVTSGSHLSYSENLIIPLKKSGGKFDIAATIEIPEGVKVNDERPLKCKTKSLPSKWISSSPKLGDGQQTKDTLEITFPAFNPDSETDLSLDIQCGCVLCVSNGENCRIVGFAFPVRVQYNDKGRSGTILDYHYKVPQDS